MRNRKVCKTCRRRHIKCDFDANNDGPCEACVHSGTHCEWSSPIRFESVTFGVAKVGSKRSLHELEASSSHELDTERGCSSSPPPVAPTIPSPIFHHYEPDRTSTAHDTRVNLTQASSSSRPRLNNTNSPLLIAQSEIVGNPHTFSPLRHRESLTASLDGPWPFKSRDEAEYFLHFRDHLSPWLDVCDRERHFGTDIPRRAIQSPLLLQGIYAWASLHLSIWRGEKDVVSYRYYDTALQLLIPVLNDLDSTLSDELLAVIVILRSYEEFSDSDQGTHLFGSARLLDYLSNPSSPGTLEKFSSLSKAVRWVILRQWIYFALTKSEPLNMQLENYIALIEVDSDENEIWCNQAVLLFARILKESFQPQTMTIDVWERLQTSNEDWSRLKPPSFQPLWEESSSTRKGQTFPAMLMMEPIHVVGLQHYHLSRILLAIFDPFAVNPGFESFKRRLDANVTVIESVKQVIGLAINHPNVVPATFHACHILQKCGSYLTEVDDRQQTIEFLRETEGKARWPMVEEVRRKLEEQWKT